MKQYIFFKSFVALLLAGCWMSSCTKFTEIDPPKGQLIGATAFNSDSSALSAVLGIYHTMNGSALGFGYHTQYMGLSADELIKFNPSDEMTQIQQNQLVATNRSISQLWSGAYEVIGRANSCIENLGVSKALDVDFKKQLDGEARFLRAFSYFYLVNQYGPLPLITNTDWKSAQKILRSPAAAVYELIKSDLKTAMANLGNEKKIRAGKLSATALLARVYLYNDQFDSAYLMASEVIKDPLMPITLPDLSEVFVIASPGGIFQLQTSQMMRYVSEAGSFIPPPFPGASPNYALTSSLEMAFEPGDQRKEIWLRQVTYNGQAYYYPYKYKSVGMPTEYYVLLRLAEQYLIRAEAAVRKSTPDLASALKDINAIRQRAGLDPLSQATLGSPDDLLTEIMAQRRVELFAELGHRWLDLKRTHTVDQVMATLKPKWKPEYALYPIPYTEIQKNTRITQNDEY